MNDIEMELWMARQEGLQAMYQERVANPNRVKTMEEDLAEQMVVAQKAMAGYSDKSATKFGYKPYASDVGVVLQALNKVEVLLTTIGLSIGIIPVLALNPVAGAAGFIIIEGIILSLFKIPQYFVKLLDIQALLCDADRAELMAIVNDSKSLYEEVGQYKNWNDVPKDLKQRIRNYVKKEYIVTNNMKKAVNLAKAAALKQASAR